MSESTKAAVPMPEPKPEPKPSIPVSLIETKRAEMMVVKQQLEFQLNGVVNQLHLIDQLLQPEPPPKPPEPDNII